MAEGSGGKDMPPKKPKNPLNEFANFIPERPTGLGGITGMPGQPAAPTPPTQPSTEQRPDQYEILKRQLLEETGRQVAADKEAAQAAESGTAATGTTPPPAVPEGHPTSRVGRLATSEYKPPKL